MNHLKKINLFLCFLFIFIAGCQKDQPSVVKQSTTPTSPEESSLLAEQTFSDINSFTDNLLSESGLKSQPVLTCPAVTLDLTAIPYTLSLDWGTGCKGTDNIMRAGKISVCLTGKMNVENSVATFSFDNFYSEGYKITGVHRITYKGFNTGTTNPRYAVFTEARIDFPDQKFLTYRAEYWRILAEGASTTTLADDVWRIEGTSSGTTVDGLTWSSRVSSALVKSLSCRWISKGEMMITPKDLPEFKVDFGDGTCDNKATVIKGGLSVTVLMK